MQLTPVVVKRRWFGGVLNIILKEDTQPGLPTTLGMTSLHEGQVAQDRVA